jgi:hypothetical protein
MKLNTKERGKSKDEGKRNFPLPSSCTSVGTKIKLKINKNTLLFNFC